MESTALLRTSASLTALLVVLGFLGGGYALYRTQQMALQQMRTELANATSSLSHSISELSEKLVATETNNTALFEYIRAEADKTNQYGKQVESLASTVGLLEKLSKTDKELLQKYSNVYFLSENFVPAPLVNISPDFLYKKDAAYQIHQEIEPYLTRLLQDASAANNPLLVLSAYRSFGKQADLKTSYKVTYGAGSANQFSADQGYSEHQLGSTVDFTTKEGGENLNVFEKTTHFAWLQAHAHEYGFILSYPKGNKYFVYEPWHWRFVGRELAVKLFNEKKSFYDLDQREINLYLVKIFD